MSAPAPFARISFQVGEGSRTECFTYADSSPILDIHVGNASVGISVVGREINDAALRFARELARQGALFASEVERLHAERTAPYITAADQAA